MATLLGWWVLLCVSSNIWSIIWTQTEEKTVMGVVLWQAITLLVWKTLTNTVSPSTNELSDIHCCAKEQGPITWSKIRLSTGNNFPHFHTRKCFNLFTFMQLLSWKVLGKSVAMTCPTISTAWCSRWCFLTKSSLARMAQPLPSDVGLHQKSKFFEKYHVESKK